MNQQTSNEKEGEATQPVLASMIIKGIQDPTLMERLYRSTNRVDFLQKELLFEEAVAKRVADALQQLSQVEWEHIQSVIREMGPETGIAC